MRNILFLFGSASLLLASCGGKNEPADSVKTTESINEAKFEDSQTEPDMQFAVAAAEGNMLEVQLGELAQTNATSPKVKEFGKTMMTDHTLASDELKELAATKKIALPAALGTEKTNLYNELRDKKGNEFDKAYIDHMIKDHEEDLKLFRDEADKGKDLEIKAWAGGKLPMLERHLQLAQETQKWVK